MSLFEQVNTLRRAIRTFNSLAITNLKANDNNLINKDNSIFLITALAPHIGHNEAINIVHEAINSSKPIKEIILEKELLTKSDIDQILDDNNLTNSGIALEELRTK
jgi:aspartate ammonia-lyase